MAGGDGLRTNISQHTETTHQETGTNKIQKKSTKDIQNNLSTTVAALPQMMFDYIVEKNQTIKKVFEISEFKDFFLKTVVANNNVCKIEGTVNIDVDVEGMMQLLKSIGFKKGDTVRNIGDGVMLIFTGKNEIRLSMPRTIYLNIRNRNL